jgi:hypothetical protein
MRYTEQSNCELPYQVKEVKANRRCAQLIKHYAIKTYGRVDVEIHVFLTWHYLEVGGQPHAPATLPPGKERAVHLG